MSNFQPLEVVDRGSCNFQTRRKLRQIVKSVSEQGVPLNTPCHIYHTVRNSRTSFDIFRLWIGRDDHLDQSGAYDISSLAREYGPWYYYLGWSPSVIYPDNMWLQKVERVIYILVSLRQRVIRLGLLQYLDLAISCPHRLKKRHQLCI